MRRLFYILLFVLIAGCTASVIPLGEVEINEYEGSDLSSIDDFRENSILGPQYVDINDYKLIIEGLVGESINLTYDEVLELQSYSKIVTLYCVEGWSATILWEGVLVSDLLELVNISAEADTLILYAYDGYSTSLPLEYIFDNNILLAYKMNGLTLPPERGYPFQLVAEDKYGYKWIKWVTNLVLSDDSEYRGFWESRGWNKDADVGGSLFD